MPKPDLPVVAIIGRPNVGKSALFNRLIKKRQSLVDSTPGLTRDRLYAELTWRGIPFQVVDTGGLRFSEADRMQKAIQSQVEKAMEEATLALLVCDAREGITPLDRQVASWARRWGKPVLPVANKAEADQQSLAAPEFSELGFGSALPVSSLHGLGVGELLDEVVRRLGSGSFAPAGKRVGAKVPDPFLKEPGSSAGELRVAIVGRPNVGKSSLINRILDEERVLVDDQPGTTRDPVEVLFEYRGAKFRLVDTAGIRGQKTVHTRVDAVSRIKAFEVIRTAGVCVGVLEAPAGIVRDDLRLLDEVLASGRPLCLAVNKWDLVAERMKMAEVPAAIARRAPFLRFAPVLCVSAKTGFQVLKLLDLIKDLAQESQRRLSRAELRDLMEKIRMDRRSPPGLRNAQWLQWRQVSTAPPTFQLLARSRQKFRSSDIAFLEGLLRKRGGFQGVPIRIRLLEKQR